jgi:hypothetical protein
VLRERREKAVAQAGNTPPPATQSFRLFKPRANEKATKKPEILNLVPFNQG